MVTDNGPTSDPDGEPRRPLPLDAARAGGTPLARRADAQPSDGSTPRLAAIAYASPRDTVRASAAAPPAFAWMLTNAAAWVIAGTVLVAGLAAAIGGAFDSRVVGWIAVPALLLLLSSVAVMLRNLRRHRAMAVLAYVEQAVRLNLPLPGMLRAAERAERGRMRISVARLREQLEAGDPIAASLGEALVGLPRRAIGMVAAGERTGRLPQALRRLLNQWHGRDRAGARRDPSTIILLGWYPLLLIGSVGTVGLMFLIFVLPKYRSMLRDFGVPLPPVTAWVVDAGEWLTAILPLVVAVTFLVQVGRLFGETAAPRLWRYNPFDAVTDWVAWHLPPFRGLARGRALADACHVIADALEGGHPLHRAAGEAGELHVNRVLRRRLVNWAVRLANGVAPADAARAAGLPPLVAGMLGPAAAPGNLAEAVRFLARHYDARFSRSAALLRAAVVPLLALGGGAFVAVLALAMFQPLIALMDALTRESPSAW